MPPDYNLDNYFQEIKVLKFNQLRKLIEDKIRDIDDYVFRGQADASWRLESTLDRLIRHARKTGAKHGSVDDFVEAHLDRFRLEIRGRRGDNPPKLDDDAL